VAKTPDASRYEIVDVHERGSYLVLKVKYPNCSECAYEGVKVMVFEGVTAAKALLWKEIDPHFRDKRNASPSNKAPSPIARFPGSAEGWATALAYVEWLCSGVHFEINRAY
jgi:hypothetical protein